MPMPRKPRGLILAAGAMLFLGACTSLQPDPGPPGERAARSGACNAEPVQWAIGEEATQETMGRVWRESRAGLIRPIGPRQAVTRDQRTDRVSVEIDRDNRITRVFCG